jgi:hypothetical protein
LELGCIALFYSLRVSLRAPLRAWKPGAIAVAPFALGARWVSPSSPGGEGGRNAGGAQARRYVLAVVLARFLLFASARRSFALAVDADGIRHRRGLEHGYLPFSSLAAARVSRTLSGHAVLVLTTREGKTHRFHADGAASPASVLADVLTGIERCATPGEAYPELARRGRPLQTWLAESAALPQAASYRDAPRSLAATALADPRADVEARAAASHALVASGEADAISSVARSVGPASSPLVIAAVRIAPGGDALVPAAWVDEVAPFLGVDDRAAVAGVPSDPAAHARVAEVLASLPPAEPEPEPERARRRRTRQPASGSGAGSFVGRSWAL